MTAAANTKPAEWRGGRSGVCRSGLVCGSLRQMGANYLRFVEKNRFFRLVEFFGQIA